MIDKSMTLENRILRLLWKWKVMGSMSISVHLTGQERNESPYRKLIEMQRNGLISQIIDSYGTRSMWSLTRAGFAKISPQLPKLGEYGFKSEYPVHDFICSAIHCAPSVCCPSSSIETFSEQELRRLPISSYESWVPTDERHRPDGYWCIPHQGKIRLLALEVELYHQSHEKYRTIGEFYHANEQIEEVIWIFRNVPDAMGCLQAINKYLGMDTIYHRFAILDHLIDSGWETATYFLQNCDMVQHKNFFRCFSDEFPNSELRHFFNMRKCHYHTDSYIYPV